MSNPTVCSERYTIFARPTGLNQFLLLVSVPKYDGEQLNLTRITRNEMGAYLCIATNGVPPTVSKRITVEVECEWISRYVLSCCSQNEQKYRLHSTAAYTVVLFYNLYRWVRVEITKRYSEGVTSEYYWRMGNDGIGMNGISPNSLSNDRWLQ